MLKLAINGGRKLRKRPFPAYKVIGKEELKSVNKVIRSGVLSKFLGAYHEDFYGGPEVRSLEKEWAKYFKVKHAIAVNSATSGLYAAVGAAGCGPGDEVIVSPYTMSASATAALIFNAIPVFADIEEDYYCLSPEEIEKKITQRTKAIIVVDIFGQPYDADKINKIAKKHKLTVIEDAAQSPGAKYKNKFAGTLGDIGVFSLNYHKHIHTGEGGVVVTNNDELAERVRLIRNHAESVVEAKGYKSIIDMVGYNFRMTEIEATIARCQLKKLSRLVTERIKNVNYLSKKLLDIPCLEPAKIRPGSRHVFYVHTLKFNEKVAGLNRDKFIEAVKAELPPIKLRESEGVKIGCGYAKPIYLEPLYQNKIAYGDQGCPFKCQYYKGKVTYGKGTCTVCEKMYNKILITHELIRPPMNRRDLDDVYKAFAKVWQYRDELK
jgi:dTDP-4-amino-4,6-dideoxygalactose transaminase